MLLNCVFFLLISLITIVHSIPCPSECICKPIDMTNVDFTRMSYLMDCSNKFFNSDKLIYQADQWSINEDKIDNDDDDDDSTKDYVISIDLSNSLSLKKFTRETIQLNGFSYLIHSLSLTNQSKEFFLESNSFKLPIYQNIKFLNLSSCCQQIPKQCQQLFRPLINLQILDLSNSSMYKTCLKVPGTISSKLTDLYLRNNIYDINIFSNTNHFFDGIRENLRKLDLQNSIFRINIEQENEYCLFDIFQQIKTLDLSSIKFQSNSNNIEINLSYLIKCKNQENGQQLLSLSLRQLNLQRLPEWFTSDRFPLLNKLDLSNNNIQLIDFSKFSSLRYISLAFNPIELNNIIWRQDTIYNSINLRSTTSSEKFDLAHRLKNLLKLTTNIDYSYNHENISSNLINLSTDIDFRSNEFSLNLSQTNIYSFEINYNDLNRLDISSNLLNELNLDEQIKLNYLDCSNQYTLNQLKLNQDLSNLNELKCSNNSLETIENFHLLKLNELKFLDLSNNRIRSIEKLFSNLNSRFLRKIYLQFNQIEIIQTKIFHKKLISLYEINLSWNQIHTIEKNSFQTPNLQILDLTGNPLINIQLNSILTGSLRLFYIVNNTEQLINRCKKSNSTDNLLKIYVNWFEQNGTLMNKNQIQIDKCLKRYSNQRKRNWMIKQNKHIIRYYFLHIIIGLCLIGILFGGIYLYRKNKLTIFARFQRYKQLDRHGLVENAVEMNQNQDEDDIIVMNIKESPYNKLSQVPTNV